MKVYCPYCGSEAKLVDSSEIYGSSYGMIWLCKPCDAYTGCHRSSPTHKPLGTLAKAPLRKLRQQAHSAFDPCWNQKGSSKMNRNQAYEWLSKKMNISSQRCHISMMSELQCKEVIRICATPF